MTANFSSRMPVLRLVSAALLVMGVLAPSVYGANGDKVPVCHRPLGNPANFHIISVVPSAVAAHLAHGDTLVAQEVCNDVDDDCDGVVDNTPECTCPPGCESLIDILRQSADIDQSGVHCAFSDADGAATVEVYARTYHSGVAEHSMHIEGRTCSFRYADARGTSHVTLPTPTQQEACAEVGASLLHSRGLTCNITPP